MIKLICVGKIKESYLNEFIDDYRKRISNYHKIEIVELKDSNKETESKEILNRMNNKDFNIIMDIKGKKYNSIEFSKLIDNTFLNGFGTITFIVGASDGVTEEVKMKCNERISFSDMTFPHGVFRGILLEQIYRSFKILNNESYHK
jgi:23S rRNA (pseudouridine1915-N3)-methyltransferase